MYIKLTETEFKQCINPSPLTDEWVWVENKEARKITNNRDWQVIDNPALGKVKETRKIPIGGGGEQLVEIIDDRKRIIVPKVPPEKTLAQLAAEKQAAAERTFREEYPMERELTIMRTAIVNGDTTEVKKMNERHFELEGII